MITERQRFLAVSHLKVAIDNLKAENARIEKAFGERKTTALQKECEDRSEHIAALEVAVRVLSGAGS